MASENHAGGAQAQGPKPGSNRARAWVHSILNPFIEAIEFEIGALRRGSTTWEFHSRRPEHLRPMGAYVPATRRTLEDFARARPYITPPIEEHDRLLGAAVACAGAAHDEVIQRSEFVALVQEKLAEYQRDRPEADKNPGGGYPVEKLPNLVAERMVNQAGDLTWPYTDRDFWNLNRVIFMAHAKGPGFDALRSAVGAWLAHDERFLVQLKDWHYQLVEEFDIEPDAI